MSRDSSRFDDYVSFDSQQKYYSKRNIDRIFESERLQTREDRDAVSEYHYFKLMSSVSKIAFISRTLILNSENSKFEFE
jgi:hypothetical protein